MLARIMAKPKMSWENNEIDGWRSAIPTYEYEESKSLVRSDSYPQHLGGVFFPPNKSPEDPRKHELIIFEPIKLAFDIKVPAIANSIDESQIIGWGLEVDKCIIQTHTTTRIKNINLPRKFKIVHNEEIKTKPFKFARPKTAKLSEVSRNISANVRVMCASLRAAGMCQGKASDKDIFKNNQRPFTHHGDKLPISSGRQTPLRPFTSHDTRLMCITSKSSNVSGSVSSYVK
jgi:hypothetical protein